MRTALFFGSFNPVHTGHLVIAQHVLEFTEMEEVWFVVSPHNPLKSVNELADADHRLQMVKFAIEGNPGFAACDVEFTMPVPSYSIDTLRKLETLYPERQWSIIMGSDTYQTLDKWKESEKILSYQILVYPRPGKVLKDIGGNIRVLDQSPLLSISATFIRNCISRSKSIRYLVPEQVREYIEVKDLYSDQ